jgi:hypothetical protein
MQIKSADSRQPDIVALERLLHRPDVAAPTKKRIEAEIRNIRSGENGEHDAAYEIELWFGRSENWATIHDLRIDVGGLVAQMDHLIINRLAEVWVCESKSFAEGVSVNEHGEWTRWWHGRPEGMPSPIEQNRRHVELLSRAFDDGLVQPPRRFGLVAKKPAIRSLVLVSNRARIDRPKRKVDGIDQVIKAEQLKTRLFNEFDKAPATRTFGIIGKEGLEAFARSLAALHRPVSTDWEARFGLAHEMPAPTAARPSPRWFVKYDGPCSRCGRLLAAGSPAVWNNAQRKMYCLDCAPSASA